jgi:hypothetical protein
VSKFEKQWSELNISGCEMPRNIARLARELDLWAPVERTLADSSREAAACESPARKCRVRRKD